jgi:hypothetical protein
MVPDIAQTAGNEFSLLDMLEKDGVGSAGISKLWQSTNLEDLALRAFNTVQLNAEGALTTPTGQAEPLPKEVNAVPNEALPNRKRHPLPNSCSPLSGDSRGPEGIQCPYPGCTAPPFKNKNFLSSHKYVHTTNRPHYCPVKGCPRGKGGKGFKRGTEMTRHKLTHESPGYVCPYCVD